MKERISLTLALQGGGSHAAFGWGALHRLLQEEQLVLHAVSATGSGAIQAVIMAQGMLEDGREGAIALLEQFWRKISVAAKLFPLRPGVTDKLLSQMGLDFSATTLALDTITKLFSPYQFNLFDINPLRSVVDEMVDFKALAKHAPCQLFVNATHAQSGKPRIFTKDEITLDAVMAAACLPYVFRTVYVDNAPYWDGSYTANPALMPLVEGAENTDIVLVQTIPDWVEEVPKGAADIFDRAAEISFASSLNQEITLLRYRNRLIQQGALKEPESYLHRIQAQEMLNGLGRASKLNSDWGFLNYLHDLGMQTAGDWLEEHKAALGKKSSWVE